MAYLSMGEAHRRITEYLNRFSDAVSFQDGASLKQLLSVSSNSPSLLSLADSLNVFQDANRLIKQSDKYSQFGEITAPFFRCLQSYRIGNLLDAYHAFEKAANAFLPEFRNWESAWALEALYVIAYEIRILAERADRELASNGKSPEKLKGAGSFLMKVFGVLAGKGPKRVGALYVTCQLFKIYFKLGTVHLCRSVIRSIETARIFDFEEFPKRDKVTYMYYTGRLEVFNENFPAADHKLSYALMHCNPHHEANIRMILKYLIPVKLSIGILPQDRLLEKYGLIEYSNVVQALKRGDLRLLRQALQEHEDRFLRSGVFLVLEKLELQVYQRLLKKM
ncbi:enhanced ethylene response protein 5 isoform X2 [Populus alba x Populus x berolinensis]|nr:enhanced ethylene response protein 5 isoform X2 [Populus alba x Populus x berolinensis]